MAKPFLNLPGGAQADPLRHIRRMLENKRLGYLTPQGYPSCKPLPNPAVGSMQWSLIWAVQEIDRLRRLEDACKATLHPDQLQALRRACDHARVQHNMDNADGTGSAPRRAEGDQSSLLELRCPEAPKHNQPRK